MDIEVSAKELEELYESGGATAIMDRWKCSKQTAYRLLSEANIPLKQPNKTIRYKVVAEA